MEPERVVSSIQRSVAGTRESVKKSCRLVNVQKKEGFFFHFSCIVVGGFVAMRIQRAQRATPKKSFVELDRR